MNKFFIVSALALSMSSFAQNAQSPQLDLLKNFGHAIDLLWDQETVGVQVHSNVDLKSVSKKEALLKLLTSGSCEVTDIDVTLHAVFPFGKISSSASFWHATGFDPSDKYSAKVRQYKKAERQFLKYISDSSSRDLFSGDYGFDCRKVSNELPEPSVAGITYSSTIAGSRKFIAIVDSASNEILIIKTESEDSSF